MASFLNTFCRISDVEEAWNGAAQASQELTSELRGIPNLFRHGETTGLWVARILDDLQVLHLVNGAPAALTAVKARDISFSNFREITDRILRKS